MKKSGIISLICLLVIVLPNCNTNPSSRSAGVTDKFVEDTILSLKEVQEKNRLVDSITNHKQGISLIVDKPTAQEPEFHIQAGYNGPERFETYYHFYLNPDTRLISIDDTESGNRLSLDDWRNKLPDSVYLEMGFKLIETEQVNGLKVSLPATKTIALIGKPDSTSEAVVYNADGLNRQAYVYKKLGIELEICWDTENEKTVYSITLKNPCTYKTIRSIGIGSTKEEVKKAYKKEMNPHSEGENTIVAGSIFGGMLFEFEDDRVKSIFIGASAE